MKKEKKRIKRMAIKDFNVNVRKDQALIDVNIHVLSMINM